MNILIAGVTGSGKNLLSMRLAEILRERHRIEAEIVNADSVQIYRDLKIIANHPTKSDFETLPHHLYEILSPYEKASAVFWVEQARKVINELNAQNKIAIICGGTGFYIDALLHDLSEIPTIPQEIRESVQQHFEQVGRDNFFQELCQLDPKSTEKLHPNNTQRILRAYEVITFTGKLLSEWWNNESHDAESCNNQIKSFVLLPDRGQLRDVIINRTKKMLTSGAIEEVEEFSQNFPNYTGPLNKAIGFREIIQLLNHEINFDECSEKITTKTMQYAKRQSTWFRHQLPEAKIFSNFGNAKNLPNELFENYQDLGAISSSNFT